MMKRCLAILAMAAVFLTAPVLAGSPPAGQDAKLQPNQTQLTKLNTKDDCGSEAGVFQKTYPDGSLAVEGSIACGQRDGLYRQWYPDGKPKLTCHYSRGVLNGNCRAWFEIGKKRLSINFARGKKDGDWLRFGEKVDDVAKLHFSKDVLNGPVWVLINRGSGSGTGTSYQYDARFDQGRLSGPFRFSYTDIYGREVMVAGRAGADGAAKIEASQNVRVLPQGGLVVEWVGKTARFPNAEAFMLSEVNRRVMPLYTLDFCGLEYDPSLASGGR